jgi:hypothetical protein
MWQGSLDSLRSLGMTQMSPRDDNQSPLSPPPRESALGSANAVAQHAMKKLALAILFLAALPMAAQLNDTYIIPAAANIPGLFNTRWMTQLSIFNPQLDHALKVSVTFLPTEGGNSSEALITVPPNSVAFTDNALKEIFNFDVAGGALLVATFPEDNPSVPDNVIDRAFLVTTNTFNNSPSGTYGQTIPGVWTGLQDYSTDGISAVAHGVRHIAKFGWRTNFGAVNLGSTSVTLRVNVYDKNGNTLVKNATYTIPAEAHIQRQLPVEVDHGSVEFFVDDSSHKAVVFPYVSTIDQLSGDPTYQTPTLLATASSLFSANSTKKATVMDLSNLGKKITNAEAREARDRATRIGEVTLREK